MYLACELCNFLKDIFGAKETLIQVPFPPNHIPPINPEGHDKIDRNDPGPGFEQLINVDTPDLSPWKSGAQPAIYRPVDV